MHATIMWWTWIVVFEKWRPCPGTKKKSKVEYGGVYTMQKEQIMNNNVVCDTVRKKA